MTEREIDQQLVERVQRGDKAAFDLLVVKYQRKIFRLLSRLIRDSAEIEDVGLDDPMTPRFARVLRYLANPPQEEQMLRWLPKAPPGVARDLALGLGHLESQRPLDELVPLITGDRSLLDRALLYGLGMRQALALQPVADDERQPTHVRAAAEWWLRQGGAVRT